MRIRKLTEQAEIVQIYNARMKQDFPPNELRPLSSILRACKSDNYYCYVLETDAEILGYAYFARNGRNYLLDYLAIDREHRDQGLGTVFLSRLADCFQTAGCILVEAEDPDAAQNRQDADMRERRLRFYRHCGYRLTDVKTSVFGADYRILEVPTGKEHAAEEIAAIYSEIYRTILPDRFYRSKFRITSPDLGKR